MNGPVLVLGAGQVGTFTAAGLVEAGADVFACDRKPSPGYFRRFGPQESPPLITLNAHDEEELSATLERISPASVVLCAGGSGHAFEDEPARARRLAVDAPLRAARTAVEHEVGRLVFVSTVAVYGTGDGAPTVDEDAEPRPRTEYGRAKLEAETRLREISEDSGGSLDVRVVRLCGLYGPLRLGRGSRSARKVESLLVAASRKGRVRVQATRPDADEYLYAADAGRAIAATALADGPGESQVLNVGAGEKTPLRELCDAVERVIPDAAFELEIADPDRPVDPSPTLSVEKARTVLGFEPRYDLEAGLRAHARALGIEVAA